MNLRKLWYWFWSTVVVGGISTLLVSFSLMVTDHLFVEKLTAGGYLFNGYNSIVSGMTFGVFSLMGFFAYLMVNYIALSIFRKPEIWKSIQVILTIITVIDLVVLPLNLFDHPKAWYFYLIIPVLLVAGSFVVANYKVKATNKNAWIPTMFFMIVVTAVESYPALKVDEFKSIALMVIPIFLCNAWQILQLHKLVRKPD